jgi:hypothetical protein
MIAAARALDIWKTIEHLDVAAAWLVVESMGVRRALVIKCGLKTLIGLKIR